MIQPSADRRYVKSQAVTGDPRDRALRDKKGHHTHSQLHNPSVEGDDARWESLPLFAQKRTGSIYGSRSSKVVGGLGLVVTTD
jgi:hypothetical protein